jgi:hypothetical protein
VMVRLNKGKLAEASTLDLQVTCKDKSWKAEGENLNLR